VAEIDREALLARFSRGTLDEHERRVLYEAALDDQELFDALSEEEALRDLLDHPATRPAVLPRLKPSRRPPVARFTVPLAIAASLAAVAVGTMVLWRAQPPDMLQASRDVPEARTLWSDSEPTAKTLPPLALRVELGAGTDGPGRFKAGAAMRLEVGTSAEARVAILVNVPGITPRVLVPPADAPPPNAGPQASLVLGPEQGLRAPRQPGSYRLRVLAVRADGVNDLASLRQRVTAGEATIADVDFEVVP